MKLDINSSKRLNHTLPFNYVVVALFIVCLLLPSCKSSRKAQKEESSELPEVEHTVRHKKEKQTHDIGELVVEEALTWLGTPYVYARQNKGVGTDCSGLTMVVWDEVGNVKIPRNSAKQAEFCSDLKAADILPGDLVFFATGKDKNKVSHVGIMIDKNRFVHASSSRGVVVSEISSPYYQRTFIKFGRVPR